MNWLCVGKGGGVQRSVGNDKRSSGQVDACPTGCARSYLCMAVISSSSIFHQAEAHLTVMVRIGVGNKIGIIDCFPLVSFWFAMHLCDDLRHSSCYGFQSRGFFGN